MELRSEDVDEFFSMFESESGITWTPNIVRYVKDNLARGEDQVFMQDYIVEKFEASFGIKIGAPYFKSMFQFLKDKKETRLGKKKKRVTSAETNDEEMLELLQHKWQTVSAQEKVQARTYLFTKIGKGKAEHRADTPKETTDFVIAILGLTDREVDARKKDLATLIRNVNKEFLTRPVTFVLYDRQITSNKVITTAIDTTLPTVTIVAVRPPLPEETPFLSNAMNEAHRLTQSTTHPLGKRADFALSDYSSPAWCVDQTVLSGVAPFLRVNGKLLVINEKVPQWMPRSGETYYQNMTAWQDLYEKGGFKFPVDKIDGIVSPLPHYKIKRNQRIQQQKYHTHSAAKEEKTVDEEMLDLLERLFGPNSQEEPITLSDFEILQVLWEEGSNFAERLFLPTREEVQMFALRDGPLKGPENNKWREFSAPRMKNSDIFNIFSPGDHWPNWRIYLQYKWQNSHLNPKDISLPVSSNAFAGGGGATSDEHIQQKYHDHSATKEERAVELFSRWMLVFMENERTITEGAKGPVKKLHWFWWVFPTTLAGQHDTFKVHFSTEEMKAVLKLRVRSEWEPFLNKWSRIGKKITDGRLELPIEADRTRLHFFEEEWKKALEEVPNDGVHRVRRYFAEVLHFDSKSARQKKKYVPNPPTGFGGSARPSALSTLRRFNDHAAARSDAKQPQRFRGAKPTAYMNAVPQQQGGAAAYGGYSSAAEDAQLQQAIQLSLLDHSSAADAGMPKTFF